MAISAMSVVFLGLILLYVCFKYVGKLAIRLRKRNAMQVHNITDKQEAKEKVSVKLREKSLLPSPWLCMNTREPIMMWKKPF